MTHELKILPEYYEEVLNGNKTFEIRKNDRGFKVNDTILFFAWDGEYLDKPSFCRRISYVLESCFEYGLMDGYVILGLDTTSAKPSEDAISRQKALLSLTGKNLPKDRDKYIALVNERIKALPPANPTRPKGEWEEYIDRNDYNDFETEWYVCNKCNHIQYAKTNFCSNCGAEMRGEEHEGDKK